LDASYNLDSNTTPEPVNAGVDQTRAVQPGRPADRCPDLCDPYRGTSDTSRGGFIHTQSSAGSQVSLAFDPDHNQSSWIYLPITVK
jgi:hypothetical protein